MKISVLAYHSANIAGNDYHNNDHVAFKQDLKFIKNNNIKIISTVKLVAWLTGNTRLDEHSTYVVLTFDDGNEMDFTDWHYSEFGMQKSFYTEMKNSNQYTHATAFVIASPSVRETLENIYCDGHKLLGENWWKIAARSNLISIENHSWDHVHPTIDSVKQQNNKKGDFSLINTSHDAKSQIADATNYIETVLENKDVSMFAYPYGHYNSFLTDEYFPNQQNKIVAAFTCEPKHVTLSTNVWKIPRFVCGHDWKSIKELKDILL